MRRQTLLLKPTVELSVILHVLFLSVIECPAKSTCFTAVPAKFLFRQRHVPTGEFIYITSISDARSWEEDATTVHVEGEEEEIDTT